MNVKRFTGRTSRDALMLVRQAFGDDAVVVSTRPCAEGVEVLAMAPESVQQLERVVAQAPAQAPVAARRAPARPAGQGGTSLSARMAAPVAAPMAEQEVDQDVEQLSMSTLSFQDYVRERMLKRREQELKAQAPQPAARRDPPAPAPARETLVAREAMAQREQATASRAMPTLRDAPMAHEDPQAMPILAPSLAAEPARREMQQPLLDELRSMRGMIEQRFGALAFMEKLQKQPRQA
ncbi:MAG: flagellar biosynthesis protein FlhF, partial [Rhodoferax sp.]|nr:flagellar biosynthesis protein FlhF [Rhodoferax sp.]